MSKVIENEKDFDNADLKNKKIRQRIAAIIAIVLAAFQMYTAYFGAFGALRQRTIHIVMVFLMVILLKPIKKEARNLWTIVDILLVVASVFVGIYMMIKADQFTRMALTLNKTDMIVGTIVLILVFETTRRVMGWIMPTIAGVFLAYVFLGPYLPSIVAHRGYGLERVSYQMFFTMEGILGSPMGISATFVAAFIIFAAFLRKSGAGDFFLNIAFSLFGRFRGGPAKAAIVSSTLFGTLSGSSVANVVGTGTFTIPLMQSTGYAPHFAAAIEAVASTGGQLMPPVMGAAAFLMIEFIGIPYPQIAKSALVPALLFYFAVYLMVDLEADKKNLVGMPKEKLPSFSKEMSKGWPFILPLAVLIFLLGVVKSTPTLAAFWSIVTVLAISIIDPRIEFGIKDFFECLENGGKGIIEVAVACATAGIIIGSITLTGLGMKLSTLLITIAGGNLFLLLILTAVVCIVLGMGVPTTGAYLLVATLVAPTLIKMGVMPLAAHMFVFYYAVVAMITPPVAVTAYAAAGIAKCNPAKTGFTAVSLGIVALVIPFMMVYGPQLLLYGSAFNILISIIGATIGVTGLSIGVHGWLKGQLTLISRVLMIIGGLSMIKPGFLTDIIGVVLIFFGLFLSGKIVTKKEQAKIS